MKILTLVGMLLSLSVCASTHVTGTFFATRACSAYVAKNKTLNPDQLMVVPQAEYAMIEISRKQDPAWYRIRIPHHLHPLRWVSKTCGKAHFYQWGKKRYCTNTPGLADSHVLALSWLPGFCETFGFEVGKPECQDLNEDFYAVTHMSLHGLWPNQKICGPNYGFCGVEPKYKHCDYPLLKIGQETSRQLKDAMPSYAYGGCLERHEWHKHGSCQLLAPDDYFSLSTRMVREANATPLGEYLHEHAGKTVLLATLFSLVEKSFGEDAVNKIYFGCQRGILVDMWLQLPAELPKTAALKTLVSQGPDYPQHSSCPERVQISDFRG